MKEFYEYAIEKLESEKQHSEGVLELFSNKENRQYRKDFYELTMINRKKKNKKIIPFDEYVKLFLKGLKEDISNYKKMINFAKEKLES